MIKNLKLLSILLVICLALTVFFYSKKSFAPSNVFKIKQVGVEGSSDCGNGDEVKKNILGQNFFFVPLDKINQELKKKFICLEDVKFTKKFPDKLDVKFIKRTPVFKISSLTLEATSSSQTAQAIFNTTPNTSEDFLIDRFGVIFTKANGSSNLLPVFITNFTKTVDYQSADIDQDQVLKLIEISKKIKNIKNIKIDFDQIYIDSEQKVIMSFKKDINVQLGSLQLILEQAKMVSKMVEQVDVRFDKPYVIYSPKTAPKNEER